MSNSMSSGLSTYGCRNAAAHTKPRVAVIGVGKMGLHHVRTILSHKLGDIVAVVDKLYGRKKQLQIDNLEIPFLQGIDQLFEEFRPDVVHICTPPSDHVNTALSALKSGCNIYVEKPFAPSLAEASEVMELAKESGLKVCAGHQLLFEKPSRRIFSLIDRIGTVVHVESYFSFRPVRRNMSSVEQTLDILPHPVYLLVELMLASMEAGGDMDLHLQALQVKADGDVHGLVQNGNATGILSVTLRGRPVESYVKIVGTNGSLYADYTLGVTKDCTGPGTSRVQLALNPYIEAGQLVLRSTRAIFERVRAGQKSYPGLPELIKRFYDSLWRDSAPPIAPSSILGTVHICELIEKELRKAESKAEQLARISLQQRELDLPRVESTRGRVLVTGGTGFLGRRVVRELRADGWAVRALARSLPPPSQRIPGIEYCMADLAHEVDEGALKDISTVVHLAAETSGGKEAHELNTVAATRNIMEAAAKAHVRNFVHLSSLAVLESNHRDGAPIDERTPVDPNSESRGPYVWGKAEAERLALQLGERLGMNLRVIRPGPLVDYSSLEPPGRLGREIGNLLVAAGPKSEKLSVCSVDTAAAVIRSYVENLAIMPTVVNLVERNSPTRGELVRMLVASRPHMRVVWVPSMVLKCAAPLLMALQKFVRKGAKPVNIKEAFSSVNYRTDLADRLIDEATRNNS